MMNIPNILTFFRLLTALCIGLPFLFLHESIAAAIALLIFALASITDFLDGYLARKWDQVSELGRMLDPIADKVLVLMMLAILLAVIGINWMILIPTAVICFREVLVSGMREFLGDRAVELQVTNLGKLKTMTQMMSLSVLLLSIATIQEPIYFVGIALLWIAMFLTALSGADYAYKAISLLEN